MTLAWIGIITKIFQGEVKVESQTVGPSGPVAGQKEIAVFDEDRGKRRSGRVIVFIVYAWNAHCSEVEIKTSQIPFLFLALDLPPAPLYQDEAEKNIIPQVPLTTILQKYDGKQVQVGILMAMRWEACMKLIEYYCNYRKLPTKRGDIRSLVFPSISFSISSDSTRTIGPLKRILPLSTFLSRMWI